MTTEVFRVDMSNAAALLLHCILLHHLVTGHFTLYEYTNILCMILLDRWYSGKMDLVITFKTVNHQVGGQTDTVVPPEESHAD